MGPIKVLTGSALALALFIIMGAVVYAAPGATSEIQGTIKDALGRPLSGASLRLESPDKTIRGRTKSDADGHFVFSGVKPGTYAVLGEKPGFQAGTAVVTVEAGAIATTTLTLAARETLEISVEAERLNQARNGLSPTTGGSSYTFDQQSITALPAGENTSFNQVLLQAPGVANDSFGQLHVRGDHANTQYRIDGVILPEGITGFGQVLDTQFANQITLLTGALPAQFGLRTAGVIDIQTKAVFENGGYVDLYGGSRDTIQPTIQYGGSDGKLNYFFLGSNLYDGLGIENPTPSHDAIHDNTDQVKSFGYASYLLSPTSRVTAMFGSYDGWFQIPNNPGQPPLSLPFTRPPGYTSFDTANLNERQYENNRFGVLAYQSTIGSDFDYQVSYVARYTSVRFMPDPLGDLIINGVASNVSQSSLVNGLQGDGSYRLNDRHTIRMGFTTSYEDTTSDNISTVFPNPVSGTVYGLPVTINDNEPKNGNTISSVYLQDEWKPFAKWTINYGLRYDYMSAYVTADQVSPRVGVVYKMSDDTTLHAGYARYFTPPPTELIAQKTVSLYNNTSNAATVPVNSAVEPERSHYFDAGVIQKIGSNLNVGVDAYYKITTDLIDEGQFGQALIFAPFNYAKGRIEGVEVTGNYHLGNFTAYGNLAVTQSLGKDVVSGQYNFSQAELDYIANNWIHCDHDEWYTGSTGVSYRWWETLFSADATYGSGLRAGFANTQSVPYNVQLNLGAKRKFNLWKCGPVEARVAVINALDRVNEIRTGTGIGVFAPQYGPRIGFFGGLKYIF
jgi:outer membrane receptor protein involved in Fe transport